MSLNLAQRCALDLARTLMVCVVLVQIEGGYGVMPAAEFDGPVEAIVREYDPFA
jgi:hypothetical protein